MEKQRRWRGTSFEVEGSDPAEMLKKVAKMKSVTYCAWQLEMCPTTQRLHYQWYMEFNNASTWNACKKLFGDSSHCLRCDANEQHNTRYVTKPETHVDGPWIYGEPSKGQGARSDLKRMVSTLKEYAVQHSANEAFALACDNDDNIFRYATSAKMLVSGWQSLNNPKTTKERKLIIRCGAAGAGKSLGITRRFGEENLYRHPGGEWFDGYTGQKACVIDDVSLEWFMKHIADIKRWTDWSPIQVPVKGGYVWNGWDYLAITSNFNIHKVVMEDEGLQRRCEEVTFFEKDGISFKQTDILLGATKWPVILEATTVA